MAEVSEILIVEDDALVRYAIKEMLARAGYCVKDVENGEAALTYLKNGGGENVALILTDFNMPGIDSLGINGSQLAQRVDAAGIKLPVVLMSTETDDVRQMIPAFSDMGIADFLPKPFEREDLLRMVRKHLH